MSRVLSFALMLVVFSAAGACQSSHKPPPELMDRILERLQADERNAKAGNELVATEHSVNEDLKEDGSVRERFETVREPVLIDGHIFQRTISRNGQPLTGKYLKQEQAREEKFRSDLHETRKQDQIKLDREFLNRFSFQVEGEGSVQGRPAWIVRFTPRPGDKPERNRLERILNRLQGRAWVDQKEYEIMKVESTLIEPVSFFGFVGKVRRLEFSLDQTQHGGLWAPAHTDLRLEARALMTGLRQHVMTDYSNFRLKSEMH
ncbi:MAG: hypothetical protein JOZ43_06235 [Acidobacteriales bacterium]|nr:hypothetical protein [Terriglobales bacterium]